jgi:hypothetical protein
LTLERLREVYPCRSVWLTNTSPGEGFDLEVVALVFDEYVNSFGLADRLRFHPGDFFKDPFPSADVISMGHILHDWDLEEKRQLMAKAYDALPEGGALIIWESIIDDDRRENAFGLLMSLNMLIETPGGFDYTGADCCSQLEDAGFQETRVEHLAGPDSLVVGINKSFLHPYYSLGRLPIRLTYQRDRRTGRSPPPRGDPWEQSEVPPS